MTYIQYQNSAVSDTGIIYNWNISSNFDEKLECLINFELPYSINSSPMVKVEPQDECLVFDLTRTNFKLKRKSKRVKEVKWFAVGY